jgi:ribose 5-phosphate isomerase RpiB
VLCLGTDLLSEDQIRQIVDIFLTTPYVTGRHDRRVEKIGVVERESAQALGAQAIAGSSTKAEG